MKTCGRGHRYNTSGVCPLCLPGRYKLSRGTVHELPDDFKKAIVVQKNVLDLWETITPLARNEWICWISSGKLKETRKKRIAAGVNKMQNGMRRPCCWQGCIHR